MESGFPLNPSPASYFLRSRDTSKNPSAGFTSNSSSGDLQLHILRRPFSLPAHPFSATAAGRKKYPPTVLPVSFRCTGSHHRLPPSPPSDLRRVYNECPWFFHRRRTTTAKAVTEFFLKPATARVHSGHSFPPSGGSFFHPVVISFRRLPLAPVLLLARPNNYTPVA